MARQGWGRHTTVATGSNDVTKQVSVNAWNADLDETGMLGFDLETKTLSTDALTPVSSANIVAGESASADDFSFIVYGSSPDIAEEDILFFYKGSQVITVTHNTSSAPSNAGNIQLIGAANKTLDANIPLILQRKGNVFYEIVNSAADSVTASSTTTFTNKTIDADGTGNSITNIENADIKASAGIDATKLANGTVTSTELQYINTLSSNAQTQIDAKQATLTFGIADGNAVDIDGSGTATGEYAKFTANGIIGEEVADVRSDLSINNVENTALSTWAGTTNITTLGTIATGTWNGTAVDVAYLASNAKTQALMFAVSDETTALTTGTGKLTFRMPYAMTLFAGVSGIKASLGVVGSTSGVTTIDVNESGSTILSTKLTIDQGEKTSTTAATPPVISDTALAADAEITVDIDGLSGGATEAGLKITLIGIPA